MDNQNKKRIIEEKDIITFDLKVVNKEDETKRFKFKEKTITIGKNEILDHLDDSIVGNDLSESKIFEIELDIKEPAIIFQNNIEPGSYVFGFKIHKINKHSSREQIDMSNLSDVHDDKRKISELEEINKNLVSKIQKLESEKQLSEQIFKTKAEEMAKNAASKVEILKEEIKNKAKEEVEYKSKYAIQKLIDDLLSPLNNLHVAVSAGAKANDPNVAAYVKGFQMLTSQIFNSLEMHGIKVIEPKEGELFNPELHQVQEIVDDSMFKKDQITKLISRGYSLHDRVLKPAIVIVAK